MICPNCGTANADTAKFCKGCGNPLESKRPIENTNFTQNNHNSSGDNKRLVLICATVIICIAIIAAAFIALSNLFQMIKRFLTVLQMMWLQVQVLKAFQI